MSMCLRFFMGPELTASASSANNLISMVGAHRLEPWTR
jgi:hypothetical protein